ncbi:MAG TPA: imidazole glycerol phosphate synthase subunit HisH, partial [Nitrospiraceae bacterium]|nr:imidazole glycerol phosphate synthase subunit HisH [Nitrospiraceae bacterium]
AIIDYGMGNLRSVHKAFEAVGHDAVVTRAPQMISDASHVVLPGVGAFADCMVNLERYGLIEPIQRSIACGKPFLGICLGLQLLFSESEEFGVHKGLGIVPGRVRRFPAGDGSSGSNGSVTRLKVPHMGWNALAIQREAPPLRGIGGGAHVYFVHSYYVEPLDPSVISTMTEYGVSFVSSIWRQNIFACQFHPEKSQSVGLRIVQNFGDWR